MKKNGFIATSLIYSFFLIFITLFLTIIAEGLQQKLWLNEIEKGIKDEINNSIGIKDFEVGDIIASSSVLAPDSNIWIISKIEIDVLNSDNNAIYFYSYNLFDNVTESEKLIVDDVKQDLEYGGIYNNTYLNKLVYNFSGEYYNLSGQKIEKNSNCLTIKEDGNIDNSSCNVPSENKYRKRVKKTIGNKKYTKTISEDGSITITGEV